MRDRSLWKPLTIAGAVLLMNSLVFWVLTLALADSPLWGAALGCLIVGVPLFTLGLISRRQCSTRERPTLSGSAGAGGKR
ncbi:hypothetical protein ACGK9R_04040 [Halomonas sp. HNIBRBA4712]|uniref:hypothetical protein n=1 Tax=Halomonas sp. HNIBRBA4712 TaxID=3373087 RepID=UPI003744C5FB